MNPLLQFSFEIFSEYAVLDNPPPGAVILQFSFEIFYLIKYSSYMIHLTADLQFSSEIFLMPRGRGRPPKLFYPFNSPLRSSHTATLLGDTPVCSPSILL